MISVAFYSCLNELYDYDHVLMMQTCLLVQHLLMYHARYDVHRFSRGDSVSKFDDSSETLGYLDYFSSKMSLGRYVKYPLPLILFQCCS